MPGSRRVWISVLWGMGIWAGLIAIGWVCEGFFGHAGPEHGYVPVYFASAILFGSIPAIIVAIWKYRSH